MCSASSSSGPAITMASLFASSTRLPVRAAASVDSSPAAPTMAASTVSQSSPDAASTNAAAPEVTRVRNPAISMRSRRVASSVVSAITASSGSKRRHSSASSFTCVLAVSTLARKRCGWRAITSSAALPIEPVAPITAICRNGISSATLTITGRAGSCRSRIPASRRKSHRDGRTHHRGPGTSRRNP